MNKYNELSILLEKKEIDDLIADYRKSLNEQSQPTISGVAGAAAITTLVLFVIRWLAFVIFLENVGTKKENIKLSKKISDIVGEPDIKVWEIKSNEVNAFTTGSKNMYYFKGIVTKLNLTEDELISIMLHEYGHRKGKHSIKQQAVFFPSYFILNFIFGFLAQIPAVGSAFLSIVPLAIIMQVYGVTAGRKHELYADRMMVEYGYKKAALSAFKKLYAYVRNEVCTEQNISSNSQKCKDLIVEMHKGDEHPDFQTRIDEISSLEIIKALSSKLMSKLSKHLSFLRQWMQ